MKSQDVIRSPLTLRTNDFADRNEFEILSTIDKSFNEKTQWTNHCLDVEPKKFMTAYAEWLKKELSEYVDATLAKYLHFTYSDSENEKV